MSLFMNSIDQLLELTRLKIPWALARFNDGEMMAIRKAGVVIARGAQLVSDDLSAKLRRCLIRKQKNYWIGLPCQLCYPDHYRLAQQLTKQNYAYRTFAVVLTNRNLNKFKTTFPERIQDRDLIWVGGKAQKLGNLPFEPTMVVRVEQTHSWNDYPSVESLWVEFPDNAIVLLSCGPLSRVLSCEWFQQRPDLTIIDVGSVWEPETRGISHKCHNGTLAACRMCN